MIREFNVETNKRNELLDITSKVKDIIKESKVNVGICVVYCPHTTAAITINEGADPDVQKDIIEYLNKLVPESVDFRHSEGNSDSHIKSVLVGASEMLIIKDGRLVLGQWQSIYFAEFDGPRKRKVIVNVLEG